VVEKIRRPIKVKYTLPEIPAAKRQPFTPVASPDHISYSIWVPFSEKKKKNIKDAEIATPSYPAS
jgi:hypothetical protein